MNYRIAIPAACCVLALGSPALCGGNESVYTLYRNSLLDGALRIHVATFDTVDGADYNAQNCALVADLMQMQDGVRTRFWCEPGRYRR